MNCLIIAGSPDCDVELIRDEALSCDLLICADRGYSHAKRAGVMPDIVIGDFDSCRDEVAGNFETVKLNTDKDFTDTLVCAEKALEYGCKEITILSALGGRLDHTLANFYLLSFINSKGGRAVLLSAKERIELMPKGSFWFDDLKGLTFSLFPFGCESAVLSVKGARYELDEYTLKSEVPIGVSNVFSSERCEIKVSSGAVIIIINQNNDFL